MAAVFFVPSITVGQITDDYRAAVSSPLIPAKKVRILIVPGHQPEKGGTDYKGVYERDVVVDIADALAALLQKNPHYEVMVARTKSEWNPILQSYFDTHALEIDTFRQSQALQMANHLADGSILPQEDQVYHTTVPSEAAEQLYGINKWAGEHAYDITLHLHINDYAGRREADADPYTGFAVYAPNHQFSNAEASLAIGRAIAARLNAYHATSTLPKESAGVVEDQQLIAVGSNNSANAAALLLEYGYIYEPQLQDASVRPLAIEDYAYETYLGLQDFFKDAAGMSYGTAALPYDWSRISGIKRERGPQIYALQSALRALGYYPPSGESFSDCPLSGVVGSCTRAATMAFQRAHDLTATGLVGERTRAALSEDIGALSSSPISL